MLAYIQGDAAAQFLIRRDDGLEESLPVAHFFRTPKEFSSIEQAALDRCRGRVLDIGAGSGLHSLCLQERGFTVSAIDLSPQAVDIMNERGVLDVRQEDILQLHNETYNSLLLLGHGIGMAENLSGLDRFLEHARSLTATDGQLFIHSLDVSKTDDPRHLDYQAAASLVRTASGSRGR